MCLGTVYDYARICIISGVNGCGRVPPLKREIYGERHNEDSRMREARGYMGVVVVLVVHHRLFYIFASSFSHTHTHIMRTHMYVSIGGCKHPRNDGYNPQREK